MRHFENVIEFSRNNNSEFRAKTNVQRASCIVSAARDIFRTAMRGNLDQLDAVTRLCAEIAILAGDDNLENQLFNLVLAYRDACATGAVSQQIEILGAVCAMGESVGFIDWAE